MIALSRTAEGSHSRRDYGIPDSRYLDGVGDVADGDISPKSDWTLRSGAPGLRDWQAKVDGGAFAWSAADGEGALGYPGSLDC